MSQLTMFSETSRQAQIAIAPHRESLREKVYRFIRSKGTEGATREEIELGLGMGGSTVRPRVKELLAAGLIVASSERRKTRSGLGAEVLVCCD